MQEKIKLLEISSNVLEERVTERNAELNKLNKELEKVLELKSIFMADVSHEFRTSLTIIQCSLELINKNSGIQKENLEFYNNIIREIKRISVTLSDLATLTGSPSNTPKTQTGVVDLNRIIPSICKELNVIVTERNINLKFEDNKRPLPLTAEKIDIEKILLNLIRNAIRYNKDNGWVEVNAEKKKEGIYLHVEDSGIGISKEEIPNVFERFYRVDRSRTRKDTGSGLGLAICKHTIEKYGGTISVKSKHGKGSKFTVFFPL